MDQSQCVVKGILLSFPPKLVVIVSEMWPSWFLITGSVNFECTAIYSDDAASRRILTPLLDSTTWHGLRDFSVVQYSISTWFLLSGSLNWLMRLRLQHPGLVGRSLLSISFNRGTPSRSTSVAWLKGSHSYVGGVTDGSWFFGCDVASLRLPGLPVRPLTPSYGRQLRHIIIPSLPIEGFLVPQPPPGVLTTSAVCADDSTSIHPHGLLPVARATSAMIRCGCVFFLLEVD